MKRQRLTIEDHRRIAARLRCAEADLLAAEAEISGHAPVRIADQLDRTLCRLIEAKGKLESLMFGDHPLDPLASTHIYFGAPEVPPMPARSNGGPGRGRGDDFTSGGGDEHDPD